MQNLSYYTQMHLLFLQCYLIDIDLFWNFSMHLFFLDMLSVEEQQNTIRYSIQLDHCYTSRLSPNDPIPRDPLPIVDDSPDSNDVQYIHQSLSPRTTVMSSINDVENTGVKGKITVKSVSVSDHCYIIKYYYNVRD